MESENLCMVKYYQNHAVLQQLMKSKIKPNLI